MNTKLALEVYQIKVLLLQSRGGGLHHRVHVHGGPTRKGSTAQQVQRVHWECATNSVSLNTAVHSQCQSGPTSQSASSPHQKTSSQGYVTSSFFYFTED